MGGTEVRPCPFVCNFHTHIKVFPSATWRLPRLLPSPPRSESGSRSACFGQSRRQERVRTSHGNASVSSYKAQPVLPKGQS